MRINRLIVLVLALASTAICSSLLAAPPEINIPANALNVPTLPPLYATQIDNRIKYYLKIVQEGKDQELAPAVAGLIADYNRYDSAGYRYEYGKRLSDFASPVVEQAQGDRVVRIAMALSHVSEVTMQGVMDAMTRNENPAVRYLGWKGYLNGSMRSKIITVGAKPTNTMLDNLAARAQAESASAVFEPIMDMLRMPPGAGGNDDTFKLAQKRSWEILQQAWPKVCLKVLQGDGEMTRSARQGIITLDYFWQNLQGTEKNKVTQLLVDMMYSAGKSYDAAGGEGIQGDTSAQLARDCEVSLIAVTGVNKPMIQKALANSNEKIRRTEVPLAVLDWINELKSKGVVQPNIADVATATTTSAPANQ